MTPLPESPPEAETTPATCPTWCVRVGEHPPHFPPVHASDVRLITEKVLGSKTHITEVSLIQFGDEAGRIRVHNYANGHRCGKSGQVCSPIYVALHEAEDRAASWERGWSGEVADAVRAAAALIQQGLAVA